MKNAPDQIAAESALDKRNAIAIGNQVKDAFFAPPPIPAVLVPPRVGHDCPVCQVWERLRFFAPSMSVEHLLAPITHDIMNAHAAVNTVKEKSRLDPADVAAFGRAVTHMKHAAAGLCDISDQWSDLAEMLHAAAGTTPSFDHCLVIKGRTDTNCCIEWRCPSWRRAEGKITWGICSMLPDVSKGVIE